MVVGVGLELHQDLADDADAWAPGLVAAGQVVELADHLAQEAAVADAPAPGGAAALVLEVLGDDAVPAIDELLGGAFDHLVGAHPQQAGVEGVADDDALEHLEAHGGGQLESGVGLDALQGDRHDRHLRVAGLAQALAQHGGVVGGPADAAGLGDGHDAGVGVVAAVGEGADELADDHDGGEAGVVVDVAQAHLEVVTGGGLQELDLVSQAPHERFQGPEVHGAHLRHEDGVGGAHGLGEDRTGGPRQLPPSDGAARLAPVGRLLNGPGGGHRGGLIDGSGRVDLDGIVDSAIGLVASLPDGLLGVSRLLRGTGLGGGGQGAQADGGGAEVGDLVDLEARVDPSGGLQDLLDLVGGQGVDAAAKRVELDELEVVAGGDELGGLVEARVVGPLVAHPQAPGDAPGGHGLGGGQADAGDVGPVGRCLRVGPGLAQPAAQRGHGPAERPGGDGVLGTVAGVRSSGLACRLTSRLAGGLVAGLAGDGGPVGLLGLLGSGRSGGAPSRLGLPGPAGLTGVPGLLGFPGPPGGLGGCGVGLG